MSVGVAGGIGVGAAGIAGAVGGALGGGRQTQGIDLRSLTALERSAKNQTRSSFADVQSAFRRGPNLSDYSRGLKSQRDLASLFGQYQQSGGLPGEQDVLQAQGFAKTLFDPARLQLQQGFQDEQLQANQLAARLGRSQDDPILRARLAQSRQGQSALLGSQQRAFEAQQAQQLPLQRLQFATQRAQALTSLGDQAVQNRQTLLGLGSQLLGQERNWRLQTGTRYNQQPGGGIGGAIGGALGGIGAGLGLAGGLAGLQNIGMQNDLLRQRIMGGNNYNNAISQFQASPPSASLSMPSFGSSYGGSSPGFGFNYGGD